MEVLVLAVTLGFAVLAGDLSEKYLRLPAPCAWILIGSGLSFIPALQGVALPSDVVLYGFVPALLYWECLNTSPRQVRNDLRVIVLLSVGLVFTTAGALTGLGMLCGLAPAVALVLGAVLSPTDATATAALAPGLGRRIAAIVRGESLMNDGTALALYSVAVAAVVAGHTVQVAEIGLRFVYAVVVGGAAGLLVALLLRELRRFSRRPVIDDTISMLTPFVLFLPAQAAGASGVVAVVIGGLFLSRTLPRIVQATSRSETYAFWRAATHVINGLLFVLIGLQARSVVATFSGAGWARLTVLCLLACLVVVVVRLAWVPAIAQLIRILDRRPQQRKRRVPFRVHMVIAWSGFRGAVSLAAALALPQVVANGSAFPNRADIIAVTFVVIVLTVFVQGLTFPAVVRAAHFHVDEQEERERDLARTEPLRHALEHLDHDATELEAPHEVRERIRGELEDELDSETRQGEDGARLRASESQLRLRVLSRRREGLAELRDSGRIDDSVLNTAQDRLDLEEVRLQRHSASRTTRSPESSGQ